MIVSGFIHHRNSNHLLRLLLIVYYLTLLITITLLRRQVFNLVKFFLYCRGVWNVPYISAAYLMNATLLQTNKPNYDAHELDPDMSFSRHYRDKVTFLYLFIHVQ